MRLRFLGKSTQGGGSPTLYATDRDTYVVQGWKIPDGPATCVEIPESLLAHLLPGTDLATELRPTRRRWRGDDGECDTYTLSGSSVTDANALAQMKMPDHETCVEVGKQRKETEGASASRPGLRRDLPDV